MFEIGGTFFIIGMLQNLELIRAQFSVQRGFQLLIASMKRVAVIDIDCCAIMGLNQKDLENQGILA